MATAADAEPTEAMEQVGGEERAEAHAEEEAEAAAAAAEEHMEAMEQDEVEEQAEEEEEEAEDAAADEPTKAVEQVEGEEQAGEHAEVEEAEALRPALPLGRVKKIIRVDRDIKKVSAEASLLITAATELFLGSLAAGAHTAAAQRGRRAVRAAHVRAAARAHRPTADFLLDCLPAAEEAPRARSAAGSDGGAAPAEPKPLPRGTRRIDVFFQKVT